MNKILCLLLAVSLAGSVTGCGQNQTTSDTAGSSVVQETSDASAVEETKEFEPVTQETFAMDTYMTVTAYGNEAEDAVEAAIDEINRLDALFSVGNADSDISILNEEKTATVSEETYNLIKRGIEINKDTDGASNIAVYPLMVLWGFTTEDYQVPEKSDIETLLSYMDIDGIELSDTDFTVTLPEYTEIDLGSIAKGYTSSRLMDIFSMYDVRSAMVSLGGNVQVYRDKQDGSKWRVAVENPFDTSDTYRGVLAVEDMAVITSGAYERYFEQDGVRYHHIIDPATGYPSDSGLASVTIVCKDGTLADALSTALFVMGKDKAEAYWREHSDEFDMVLIDNDGNMEISKGIKDCFESDFDFDVVE